MTFSEFAENVIKGAKALIVVSIAVFFVRCSFGSLVPDVNIEGLDELEGLKVEVIEHEHGATVTIERDGEEVIILEEGK